MAYTQAQWTQYSSTQEELIKNGSLKVYDKNEIKEFLKENKAKIKEWIAESKKPSKC